MANLTLDLNETLNIKEERKDASRCIVSDILIGTSDITPAQFEALLRNGSAVGYEAFRNFIGGDYEYNKALFKGILSASDASSPRILTLEVDVDVPDIYDRGSAFTSASAPVTITCNRPFYVLNEVVATCKGGTVIASPRVTNLQVTGNVATFDVELIDVNNARVAGEISWAAKGY